MTKEDLVSIVTHYVPAKADRESVLSAINDHLTASAASSSLEPILSRVKERIDQLNKADQHFCQQRWPDNDNPNDKIQQLQKQLAREESNKVTFARQELQEVEKWLSPSPALTQELKGDGWVRVEEKDKWPPINKIVQVYTNKGQYGISCLQNNGEFDQFICEASWGKERITHWRKLPAPPQTNKPLKQ